MVRVLRQAPRSRRPLDLGDIEIILARNSLELNAILQSFATNSGLILRFAPLEVQTQGDGGPAKVVCRFVGTEAAPPVLAVGVTAPTVGAASLGTAIGDRRGVV
jgi:hypothetical protein